MEDPYWIQEAPSTPRQPKIISKFTKKKVCVALLILSKNESISPRAWLPNTANYRMGRDSVRQLCTVYNHPMSTGAISPSLCGLSDCLGVSAVHTASYADLQCSLSLVLAGWRSEPYLPRGEVSWHTELSLNGGSSRTSLLSFFLVGGKLMSFLLLNGTVSGTG